MTGVLPSGSTHKQRGGTADESITLSRGGESAYQRPLPEARRAFFASPVKGEDSSAARKTYLTVEERAGRDRRLIHAVRKLKLRPAEVLRFSRCWPHPFHHEQNLDRRLDELKLKRFLPRFQSAHDQWINMVLIKICCDAARNGIEVVEVDKEYPLKGFGVRADARILLAKGEKQRLFFLEVQESGLSFVGWKRKLSGYLKFRKSRGTAPFRVLVTGNSRAVLNAALRTGRQLLQPHPQLRLFLYGLMQFTPLAQYDSVTEDCWFSDKVIEIVTPRGRRARVCESVALFD